MDVHSQPAVGAVQPSFRSIEKGVVLRSERKTILDCGGRAECLQRSFKKKSSSFSVRRLGVAFISLGVAYFLLRCFGLTRKKPWVIPLSRSLARGGDRPCLGDVASGEDGGVGGEDDAWTEGLEGNAGERQAVEGSFGRVLGQTGHPLGWSSISTTAKRGDIRGTQALASDKGHAAAAAEPEESAETAEESYSYGGRGLLQQPHPRGTFQSSLGGDDGATEDSAQMNVEIALFKGETWDMWANRNLPTYAEMLFVSVYSRMMETASACRSLLGVLAHSQRVRLSCEVIRLLALELGALSLVREHLEHLRSNLGEAIVQLGVDALKPSGAPPTIDRHSRHIRELIALVFELKQPRPATEESVATRYRRKMISILQTATGVVGYSLGVLEGLLKLKVGESLALSRSAFEQQMDVLTGLFDVHSAQISMDPALRFYIVNCQKRTGMYPILGRRHHLITSQCLPPLRDMMKEIHQVVEIAGGLLLSAEMPLGMPGIPGTTQPSTSQQVQNSSELPAGTPRDTQHREISAPVWQPLLVPTGAAASQNLQAAVPSSPVSSPRSSSRFPPSSARHQSPQPLLMQPTAPSFSHSGFGHLLSRVRHQTHGAQPSSHVQMKYGGVEASAPIEVAQSPMHPYFGAVPLPYMARRHSSTPLLHSYSHPSRSAFLGASVDVGGPGCPSHGGHSTSNHAARINLLPPTARPTGQDAGAECGWDYDTVPLDIPQPEEPEQVHGMLADLIRGGLKLEDIFPTRKRPYQ